MNKIIKRIRLSSLYIWFRLNLKLAITSLIVILVFFVVYKLGYVCFEAFIIAAISIVGTNVVQATASGNYKDKMQIMSISIDFITKNGEITIDDILLILMSDRVHKRIVDPTKSFFDYIHKLSNMGTYEQKRCIAEALPSLYRINKSFTKVIIKNQLRHDYDEERWHVDVRRRTIESFKLIPNLSKKFILSQLELKQNDSIYTIIAIVESILFCRFVKENEKIFFLNRIKTTMEVTNYELDNIELIDNAISFYKEVNLEGKDYAEKAKKIKRLFENGSLYTKVFIAKNIIRICDENSVCLKNSKCASTTCAPLMLELISMCSEQKNHINIRRAMVKEDIVFCLISLLAFNSTCKKAKAHLMRLAEEEDTLIPLTLFDLIYKIYEVDKELCEEIIIKSKKSRDVVLKEKAEHTQAVLFGKLE